MKNFFKKLSLVMALALVLTSLTPAGAAKAAEAMKMNDSDVTLYLTENAKNTPDEFDFGVANKPEDWKKTLAFEWESSNEDVATVGKAGLTQAVGVGTATISCTVTDKETEEVVAVATAKVSVKANADKIEITNAPADGKVRVGENVLDLNRTLYVDGVATTKRGVVCTNYTRWTSSDETIATVDKNGVVTVLKAGEFTITAEAYQSKANDDTIVSDKVTLTSEAGLVGVAQKSVVKAEVTFDSDMSKVVNKDNLVVSKIVGTTPVKQVVKSVKFDTTGKIATVEMYVDFAAKAEYTFEYGQYKAGFVGAKLTADEVASIVLTTSTAVVNTSTKVAVKLYDANGVEITDDNALARIALSTTSMDCYFNAATNEITFFEAGKSAEIKAVYHTYKYDAQGNETTYTTAGTVVGVNKASATISNVIAYHVGTSVDWSKTLTDKMTVDNVGYKVFAQAVKTDGTKVADGFTYESADSATLIVAADGTLYPVKEGVTTVIVKSGNTVIGAVNVTVIAKATAATLDVTLSKNLISLAAEAQDSITLKVSAKDQLGRAFSATPSITLLNNQGNAPANLAVGTITPEGFSEGTYQYKVTVGNLSKVIAITAKMPNTKLTPAYAVEINNGSNKGIKEIDLAINLTKLTADYNVQFNLVKSYGGVKAEIVAVEASEADAIAAVSATSGAATEAYYFTNSFNAKKVTALGGNGVQLLTATATSGAAILAKAPTGTFTVTAMKVFLNSDGKLVKQPLNTAYLTVKDTQAMPAVTVKTQSVAVGDVYESCFEVKVNNVKVDFTVGDIIGINDEGVAVSDRVFIKNLVYTTNVTINEVVYEYTVKIPVNQSILIK